MKQSERLLQANLAKLPNKRTGSLLALGVTPQPELDEDDLFDDMAVVDRTAHATTLRREEVGEDRQTESTALPDALSENTNREHGVHDLDDSPIQATQRSLGSVEPSHHDLPDDYVIDLTGEGDGHTVSKGLSTEDVQGRFGKKFGSNGDWIRYGHYVPYTTYIRLEELKVDLAEMSNRRITTETLFRLALQYFPSDADGWVKLLQRHAAVLGVDGPDVPTRHFLGNRVEKKWPSMMSRAKLQLLQAHGIDVDRRFLFGALLEELTTKDRLELLTHLE